MVEMFLTTAPREQGLEMKMISTLELTESGTAKFNNFFASFAKDGVSIQAVLFEMLDVIQDRAANQESYIYELGHVYTKTGHPELLRLSADDIKITEEEDD